MTGKDADGESRADKVRRQAEDRRKRQAEALRANLLRRKAQSRARAAEVVRPVDGEGDGEAKDA